MDNSAPVIIIETLPDKRPETTATKEALADSLRELGTQHEHTRQIQTILFPPFVSGRRPPQHQNRSPGLGKMGSAEIVNRTLIGLIR